MHKYLPASPRNKCLYLAICEEGEEQLYKLIKHLLQIESLSGTTHTLSDSNQSVDIEPEEPPLKKEAHSKTTKCKSQVTV